MNPIQTGKNLVASWHQGYEEGKETVGKIKELQEKVNNYRKYNVFLPDSYILEYGSDRYNKVVSDYISSVIKYGNENDKVLYTRYQESIIYEHDGKIILGNKTDWSDEGVILSDIPWHNQRDNGLERSYGIRGSRMCQLSALANLYEGSGITIPGNDNQPENRLLKILVDDVGRPASHCHKQMIPSYEDITKEITGSKDKIIINHVDYGDKFNDSDTQRIIDSNRPVAVGSKTTGSGHVLSIIGYDKSGWIVNDSYGNAKLRYNRKRKDKHGFNGHNGIGVHYEYGKYGIQKNWRAYMPN